MKTTLTPLKELEGRIEELEGLRGMRIRDIVYVSMILILFVLVNGAYDRINDNRTYLYSQNYLDFLSDFMRERMNYVEVEVCEEIKDRGCWVCVTNCKSGNFGGLEAIDKEKYFEVKFSKCENPHCRTILVPRRETEEVCVEWKNHLVMRDVDCNNLPEYYILWIDTKKNIVEDCKGLVNETICTRTELRLKQ